MQSQSLAYESERQSGPTATRGTEAFLPWMTQFSDVCREMVEEREEEKHPGKGLLPVRGIMCGGQDKWPFILRLFNNSHPLI